MKLTREQLRHIIKEELEAVLSENEEEVIEEGLLARIKAFFTGDPFKGDMGSKYKASETYKPGTYGAFAQTAEMLGIFKERNIKATKQTILAAAEGMVGGGESEASPIVGLGLALAGLVATGSIATGIGIAGVLAAVGGAVRLFYKNPTLAEKYPTLSALQMDNELMKLIDNDLEAKIVKDYEKDFIEGVKRDPTEEMPNINVFARDWLAQNLNNRTVRGAPSIDQSSFE